MNSSSLSITAQPSSLSPSCRFQIGAPLPQPGSWTFSAPNQSQLVRQLFALEPLQLTQLTVESLPGEKQSTLTLIAQNPDWATLGPQIAQTVRQFWQTLTPTELQAAPSTRAPVTENAFAQICEILKNEINPGLAAHGGSVEAVELSPDGVLSVRLSGGCQGCVASKMTLKQGIEKTLFAKVSGLREVRDVTDHSAGSKPYFK